MSEREVWCVETSQGVRHSWTPVESVARREALRLNQRVVRYIPAESAKAEAQPLEVGSAEYWHDRFSRCLAMLTETQAQLAEAQPAGTGWVSVEERLPEVGEPFNLYVPHKKLVCEGFRTSGKLWFRADGDPLPGVTHWRHLPPPPEPR